MTDTPNLALPLLQPSQAQKHVTVNEALARLDGLAQLVLQSDSVVSPPEGAADGEAWAVPVAGSGDWAGQEGRVALRSNAGWIFLTPQAGWRAWIADQDALAVHDGTGWSPAVALGTGGSATLMRVVTVDQTITAGPAVTTAAVIPSRAVVMAVTGRVTQAIGGSLSSWKLGVDGAEDRHGAGLGLSAGSWVNGVTGSPVTYWSATPLKLTATGGNFASGRVRLAVHLMEFVPPGS